jgi:SOS-response transcriptional repressor LexA
VPASFNLGFGFKSSMAKSQEAKEDLLRIIQVRGSISSLLDSLIVSCVRRGLSRLTMTLAFLPVLSRLAAAEWDDAAGHLMGFV